MAKTVLDLTPDERHEYRPMAFLEHREMEDDDVLALRRREAWDIAKKAAELLRKKFGAGKVLVFGSLTDEKWFGPWSDIDLAAWNIPPEKFYAAVAAVTGLSSSLGVDLVDIGDCRPKLRQVIEKEGIEI